MSLFQAFGSLFIFGTKEMEMRPRLTKEQKEGIHKLFSHLGRKGGRARTRNLSPEERSAASARAALTRWENYRALQESRVQ